MLITKDGTVGKVAIVEDMPAETSLNSGVLRIVTQEGFNTRFLFWVLQSRVFWNWFNFKNAGNSTIIHLYQGDFAEFMYAYPDENEQQAIADYLDSRCNQIDGIISDIQNQIEILKKYKKSLITETVTKGLDTGVPMKDSGVEWIGEIPEHWDVKKEKYGVSICNGKEIESEEGEIPVYGTGGAFKNTNKSLYKGESVLLGRKGTIDKPLFVDDEFWTVDTAFYTIMKSDLLVKLFYYYACCFDYKYYQTGSAVPSMTQSDLGSILIPEIPHKEQQEIVNFLDTKCNQIDTLIESKQAQLEKMQGYRKSLIYEYVTGKKRVT